MPSALSCRAAWTAVTVAALGVALGSCGNAPTDPEKVKLGVASVVEHWGRMTQIVECGPTTMTGHLEIHIRTKEVNGGGIAYGQYSWTLIERRGTPTEARETGGGTFSNREVVPYGDWEGWITSDGNGVTKDYDLSYELTVNSVATATGAVTPLFVAGRVTHDGCS